jgi:hypothetical protein
MHRAHRFFFFSFSFVFLFCFFPNFYSFPLLVTCSFSYLYFTYTTSSGNNYDLLGEFRMSKRACVDGSYDDMMVRRQEERRAKMPGTL